MRSKTLSYMPGLDGLRAVAVLLVFAIHAAPEAKFPGGLGVDVFFVLSGFLITSILMREHERTGAIRFSTFYAKRLLRLYPPFIAMVLTFFALTPWLSLSWFRSAAYSVISLSYLTNLADTFAGIGTRHLGHTWSLAMEEQYYLIWPPVLLLMLRRGWTNRTLVGVVVTLAALSFAGWVIDGDSAPFNPITNAGGLLLGSSAAIAVHGRPRESTSWGYVGVGVFAAVFAAETLGWMTRAWTMPIASIAVVPIMLHVAFGRSLLVRVLSWAPLVHIGLISYAFYLWHYPVLRLMLENSNLPLVVHAAVGLAISYLLSVASMKLIEGPVLRWRERRFGATTPDRDATQRVGP